VALAVRQEEIDRIMSLRKPLAASAAVIAALATASPAATASTAALPTVRTAPFSLSDYLYATCPSWYGFKNPAVGCSSWADYYRYAVWGPYRP
jgi:hypothetical protein